MSELEQLQGALDAYQGEVSSAMQTTKLTQEKLQDALSVIKVLTRERDEALEIAERTHTDMHAVRKELEQQRQRAEAAEAKLAAVPVDAQAIITDLENKAMGANARLAELEAQLAAVPSKAIYDCWYHADGQTPDESVTAVEAWLVSTGVMDKYYRA